VLEVGGTPALGQPEKPPTWILPIGYRSASRLSQKVQDFQRLPVSADLLGHLKDELSVSKLKLIAERPIFPSVAISV
jgi:hypothetical protein